MQIKRRRYYRFQNRENLACVLQSHLCSVPSNKKQELHNYWPFCYGWSALRQTDELLEGWDAFQLFHKVLPEARQQIILNTWICCAVVIRFLFTVALTRSLCRVLAIARVRTWGRSLLVVGITSATRAATSSSLTWSVSWKKRCPGHFSSYRWKHLRILDKKKNLHSPS